MRKSTKFFTLLLSLVLAMSLLGGCGTKEQPQDEGAQNEQEQQDKNQPQKEPTKIVWWSGLPEDKGPGEVVENFNKSQSDIQVAYERYTNDPSGNTKLDTALMSGIDIDCYISYAESTGRRVAANMCTDLSPFLQSDKEFADIINGLGESGKVGEIDGKLLYVPTTRLIAGWVANQQMFDEANLEIPTNWDWTEAREYVKKLTKGEGSNKVYGLFEGVPYRVFLDAGNTTANWMFKDANLTEFDVDIPLFRKTLQIIQDIQNDGSIKKYAEITSSKTTSIDELMQQKAAMVMGGVYFLRDIKDTEKYPHDFKVAFLPYPKVFGKDDSNYQTAVIPFDDFIINPNSKHKEEAIEFFKYYVGNGYQPMIKNGRIPIDTNYDMDEIINALAGGAEDLVNIDSLKFVLSQPIQGFVPPRPHKIQAELDKVIDEEVEKFRFGIQDIDTTVNTINKRCRELLSKN